MIKNAESCDPKGIHSTSFGIRLTIELTADLMLQHALSSGLSPLLQTINYTRPVLTPLDIKAFSPSGSVSGHRICLSKQLSIIRK